MFSKGNFPQNYIIKFRGSRIPLTIYNGHDAITLVEVFCRGDYQVESKDRIFVDVGANIGIASLYFLAMNDKAFVYAFEPSKLNFIKLSTNLKNYSSRVKLSNCAIDVKNGLRKFREEATGRYGGFSDISNRIPVDEYDVECLELNKVIGEILDKESLIDVLKIDTEGNENELYSSINSTNRRRVRRIFVESNGFLGNIKEI